MLQDISVDSDIVEMQILSTGETIRYWESYAFASEFLTPTDGWSFVTGDADSVTKIAPKLVPGTIVQLVINGHVQCTGIVDESEVTTSRQGGLMLRISGRDALSPLVDATVDPLFVFSAGMSLNDLFAKLITPFGFKIVSTTDEARKAICAGTPPPALTQSTVTGGSVTDYTKSGGLASPLAVTIVPDTKVVSAPGDTSLKSLTLQQAKPHSGEGVFAFLARHCKRFGLWLWTNSLGDTVIVATPNFSQSAIYTLSRRAGVGAQYLQATLRQSAKDQPAAIFAAGDGSGGNYNHARLKCVMVNEIVGVDASGNPLPAVQAAISLHKGARMLPIRKALIPYGATWGNKLPKFVYLEDDESKTPGQLESFVRRQMAERQSRAVEIKVKVDGHTQDGKPWTVNTMAMFDDDVLNVHGAYWIRDVHFSKSGQGTFTEMILIPPNTLALS